jgi:hypothetical protein
MGAVVEDHERGFNALGRIKSSQNGRNITRYAYLRSLTASTVPFKTLRYPDSMQQSRSKLLEIMARY